MCSKSKSSLNFNYQTEAGAHVDAVNEMNMTPLDIAGASVLAMIFKINQKISLKCRAAQVEKRFAFGVFQEHF